MKNQKPAERAEGKKIEELIIELAKKDLTSEKIGFVLKGQEICAKSAGIKISKILKKHNLYQDADFKNLTNNVEKLKKHLERNKHDYKAKRGLLIKAAKLRKIKTYKKKKSKL